MHVTTPALGAAKVGSVGLLALCAALIYCSLRPASMAANEAPSTVPAGSLSAATADPLLAGWSVPAVALVLSGEMHGYVEPCGCTAGQTGGLARRATLIEQLQQQRGWNVVGLDLGGTMISDRVDRQQTNLKFELARDALESMGFVSLGVGYEEARPRQDYLLALSDRDKAIENYGLRLTSANVRPYPDDPDLDITQLYRVIEVPAKAGAKPFRIVVTSVLGTTASQGIGNDLFFKILPPAEALAEILPRMQAERPDLMVLLSHARGEESEKLAQQFPMFPLVVSLGGPEDGQLKPKQVGSTWLLQVGQKGKNVGVVGVYPGAQEKFRYELVKLDGARFQNHPRLDDMMQQYQDRLRDDRPDLTDNADPPAHPSGRTFVGAQVCADCHQGSFDKWKTTGHAHAFESLSTGRADHQGRWIDRKWDAECIACHAVGWEPQQALRWASGFVDPATTPHLLGNQCENCHGPGSQHVALENAGTDEAAQLDERKRMWLSKEQAAAKTCRQCHDGDNDPHFDFEKYWPQIEHHD